MTQNVFRSHRSILFGAAAVLASGAAMLGACTTSAGSAPSIANATAAPLQSSPDRCASLVNLEIENVEIVSSSSVAAGEQVTGATNFFGQPVSGVPSFCRIIGRATPTSDSDIGFELWLPSAEWDGRLHGIGIGGFAGVIDYGSLAGAVAANRAGLATDTGHKAAPGLGLIDASWAKGHPEKVRDYGSRAVHESTVAAKQIIKAFYDRAADYSYFVGCSGGGRQGLMEAALYPEDYDGVLAGAPAQSWTDLVMAMTHAAQAQFPAGAAIRAEQMELLETEVIKQCDGLDGQIDKLVSDPLSCRFDTAKLACGTSDSKQCFSAAQITALNRVYAGPRDSKGKAVTRTYLPGGAEAGPIGWRPYITTDASGHSGVLAHSDGLYGNFIQEPFASAATFNFDTDPAKLKGYLSKELDAPADLDRFFARGGKLIMWHGWADAAIPPELTIDYNEALAKRSGEKARASTRLFMVPNVQHCWGGNGPASFGQNGAPPKGDGPSNNMVAALQHWVEHKQAPEQLSAKMGWDGLSGQPPKGVTSTRLLCAWPKKSVLRAGADPEKAESYRCEARD